MSGVLEKSKVALSGKVAILIDSLRGNGVVGPFEYGVSFEEHEVGVFTEPIEDVSDSFKIHALMFTKPW